MVPIMMRLIDIDMHKYAGVLQRIFALTVFVPIAVAACELARRIRAASSDIAAPAGVVSTTLPRAAAPR
jgi:hypothetical protein